MVATIEPAMTVATIPMVSFDILIAPCWLLLLLLLWQSVISTLFLCVRIVPHTLDCCLRLSSFLLQITESSPPEFVAFLLWYVFLVLCCIVPTCCAYRRRRIIEQRMSEQHANMAQFQQANLFFLQGNQQRAAQNEEILQQERSTFLKEQLRLTTISLTDENLKEADATIHRQEAWEKGRVVSMHGVPETDHDDNTTKKNNDGDDEKKEGVDDPPGQMAGEDKTDEEAKAIATAPAVEEDAFGADSNVILILPKVTVPSSKDDGSDEETNNNTNIDPEQPVAEPDYTAAMQNGETRELSGVCTICLCPYETGDSVTWAAAGRKCEHAFHTECIISWLSKQEEPKCPVCRQSFCAPLIPPEPPAGAADNVVPFPFSQSLAETIALARISMPPNSQPLEVTTTTTHGDVVVSSTTTTTTTPIAVPSGANS